MKFCGYHSFSLCLYDDVDSMLFDEIYNKRVLQIMTLNMFRFFFFFFFYPFSCRKKKIICHHHNCLEHHPVYSIQSMMILFSYALPERQNQWMSYHHLLSFFRIRNPFGRTLSSGLSTWLSKYYPVCLSVVAVIIAAVIDKNGKRIFPR